MHFHSLLSCTILLLLVTVLVKYRIYTWLFVILADLLRAARTNITLDGDMKYIKRRQDRIRSSISTSNTTASTLSSTTATATAEVMD